MKKVVLTSLFLLSMFVCSSQIDTFRMNGKTYCLWADTNYGRRTNALEVVCVNTFNNIRPDRFLYTEKEKTGNYITITINSYQIDEFRDFLVKMRNKYEEWSIVAKENNVTSLYKKMDITSGNYQCLARKKVAWDKVQTIVCLCVGDKDDCVNFTPYFSVNDTSITVWMSCDISNADAYSRGLKDELYTNTASMSFTSIDEINSLINCVEKENIELLIQAYRDKIKREAEEKRKQQEIYDKFK